MALLGFGQATDSVLSSAEAEGRATLDQIGEAVLDAVREVERCRDDVHSAQESLSCCLNSGDPDDGSPDCSCEENQLQHAEEELSRAEVRLSELEATQRRVQSALDEYQSVAQRLENLLTQVMPRADAVLNAKVASLQEYAAMSSPPGDATGGTVPVKSRSFKEKVVIAVAVANVINSVITGSTPALTPADFQEKQLGQLADSQEIQQKQREDDAFSDAAIRAFNEPQQTQEPEKPK